jgi:hypothetical protein
MEGVYELRPDGRKLVVETEEGETKKKDLMDLPEVTFAGVPKKFRDKHREALNAIYGFGEKFALDGRQVPLTREELIRVGIDKDTMKDLEKFGMIEGHIVELKADGRNIGGRKCIVISPEGKAAVKFFSSVVSELLSSEEPTPADLQTDSQATESHQS